MALFSVGDRVITACGRGTYGEVTMVEVTRHFGGLADAVMYRVHCCGSFGGFFDWFREDELESDYDDDFLGDV